MKKYLLMLASLFLFCSFLLKNEVVQFTEKKNDSISLIFVGDIMGHSPQYQSAYNPITKTYNYDICFNNLKPYIQNADFAIANLEVPIAGKPYSGYPNFSSPDALLDALKNSGFNVLLTANNHVLDRGKFGLERTIHQIEKRKLLHLGSYLNKNQRDSIYPLMIESNGVKLALLNCTYGTNTIVASKPNLVNYIDTIEILADIQKANKLGADIRIMTIHWGTENELHANKFQRNLAQFLVKHGINLIIGSHPHVVQNAEILYDNDSIPVPVFYSLGNCISNQREVNTNGGIMVKVVIDSQSKRISSISYLPVYVHRGFLNGVFQYHLIPTSDFLANPSNYFLNAKDSSALVFFDKKTKMRLKNFLLYQ